MQNAPLEVLDDRVGRRSVLVTTQLPAKKWHDLFDEPTVAEAILDRLQRPARQELSLELSDRTFNQMFGGPPVSRRSTVDEAAKKKYPRQNAEFRSRTCQST
ncbi:MAG TPA: hypothetical protein EYO33_13895 [Phycisphaerales bacterium]|nr:hypothetical protein [Phycisphaerales bacterium]